MPLSTSAIWWKKALQLLGLQLHRVLRPGHALLGHRLPSGIQDHGQALHSAGIEVILDVVYNHTAEGNQLGPTLCFRGIDNAAYYRLDAGEPRYYRTTPAAATP
jgi:hypothetical protein